MSKTDMDTQALIDKLSQDGPAARKLGAPLRLGAVLIAVLAVYGASVQFFLHLRPDLGLQLTRPAFAAEIALLVALVLASAWAAVLAMYPDQHQKAWALKLPYILFAALVGFLGFQLAVMPQDARMVVPPPGAHAMECALCIASVALVPSGLIFGLLRRGASVTPLHGGCCSVMAAAAIGCLTLRLAEANDSLMHLVTWHYLPTLIFAATGALLGKFLLRW